MKKAAYSIRTKIQLFFLAFILLSACTGMLSYNILQTIISHEELKSKIDEMVRYFAEVRKQEKDFILYDRKEVSFLEEGKSGSLQKHRQALMEIRHLISQVKRSGVLEQQAGTGVTQKITAIESAVEGYANLFSQLVKAYQLRGFKDHGMEGEMREVIHQLQECESKEEQWFALMLRRHEKDFFLRQDVKYVETLHKRASSFIGFVRGSDLPHMSPAYKDKTIASINNYVHYFNRIASIEAEIGLTKDEGLLGALTVEAERTEPLLGQVQQLINEKNQQLAGSSTAVMLISIGLMLACGIGSSFLLARKISDPIVKLSQVVARASIGDSSTLHTLENMKRDDELGNLIKSFGNMFREIHQKVQEISEKNRLLQITAQEEKERNWMTEGVSLFEGIMAKQANDLALLCDEFLSGLVKYTQSTQGVLFLKDMDENGTTIMKLQSCYAHNKKRYLQGAVALGEGLVGTVWQEKEAFYMTDLPESYSRIRSGLGQAKPTAIFIIPAMLEGQVEAVVEIGSFREYTENEKILVQQVCRGLANATARVRLQQQTSLLLERANALAEELKQNQEETKQQLEDLIAAQEELRMKPAADKSRVLSLPMA